MTEDRLIGWHHQLNGHGSEQTPGDGEGQGSLACFSPWDCKETDSTATEQQQGARIPHAAWHNQKESP